MWIKKTFRRSCRLKTVVYLFVIIDFIGIENGLHASTTDIRGNNNISQASDSVITDPELDVIMQKFSLLKTDSREAILEIFDKKNKLDVSLVSRSPYISIQQLLKGNIPGVYVQESNGEPGTIQNMLVRGISTPIFSNKDALGAQPAVYINGIPVIQDHPFVYDIKQYDINPIGTASNILAGFDMNEIQSIEVIKDPLKLAKLGPLASNGAIWIITKSSYTGGKNVTVNTSLSIVAPPSKIRTTNAGYERNFRKKFYDSYFHDIPISERYYPDYLKDNTDSNYFGNSDWADDYYSYASQYDVNASIGGGSANANYLFTMGGATNAGVADATSFGKYNVSFYLNMSPLEGLMVHSMLSGGKTDRNRNRNLRDRYAEVEYLPGLSTPIAPSKTGYQQYLLEYEEALDDNINNVLNGYLGLDLKGDGYYADAKLLVNYNTNTRHVFWPSTLMESVSFVSDYSGYNRRLLGTGVAGYSWDIHPNHLFDVQIDGSIQTDIHHYNYIKAYDGDDDRYKTTNGGNYTQYRFLDKEQVRLASTSASVNYTYKTLLNLGAVFRYDGSSQIQKDNRWLFSPAFSAGWNLKDHFFNRYKGLSKLSVGASWSRVGNLVTTDRFSIGPQYTSENLNWIGQSVIPAFSEFASVTRPYKGWIGYDLGWPYSDKFNIDIKGAFMKDRLDFTVSLYKNTNKDMITTVPVPLEYGYEYKYLNGMEIDNRGIDFQLSAAIVANPKGFNWDAVLNMNYNQNELKKLPDGQSELIIGDKKLKVGHAVDQFWVLKNQGIYSSDKKVPVVNGKTLSIGGIPFRRGDPQWSDENSDGVINADDKVLKGHSLPPFTGGLVNQFRYHNFDLNFHLFFALGHSALNARDHQRYDFATSDMRNTLESVREIFFWQNTNKEVVYPRYNPLSEVHPYRVDQDLFIESLSYLKLRALTLGYTFRKQKNVLSADDVYIYVTANNLFTVTDFSGDDPELVDFNGYYTGYSQPISRSVTLGLKFKF